jgi:ribosomal protein L37E
MGIKMTYHGEPHYECNRCGEITFYLDDDWAEEWYDIHYCPECVAKYKKEKEEDEQHTRDIESGKIIIKKPKKSPIPKWCPKVKGLYMKCNECGRMPWDCPFPELGGRK